VLRALASRLSRSRPWMPPEMERIIKEAESHNGVAPVNGSGPLPEAAPPAPPDLVPPLRQQPERRGTLWPTGHRAVDGSKLPGDASRASRIAAADGSVSGLLKALGSS